MTAIDTVDIYGADRRGLCLDDAVTALEALGGSGHIYAMADIVVGFARRPPGDRVEVKRQLDSLLRQHETASLGGEVRPLVSRVFGEDSNRWSVNRPPDPALSYRRHSS